MSKRLRSYVAAIMAMLFAFAIVAVPQKAWAVEKGTFYEADDLRITVDGKEDPSNPQSLTLTVNIDGKDIATTKVDDISQSEAKLVINGTGYAVKGFSDKCNNNLLTFSRAESSESLWYIGFGCVLHKDHRATINLISTSSDVVISDGSTTYGTFSWAKHNADNNDFSRSITVRVNGDGNRTFTTTVTTPNQLENTAANQQFWFTPNAELFNSGDVKFDRLTLDQVGNKDLVIDLTTVCPCGNPLCTCPGGSECESTCTGKGCNCDKCKGVVGENEYATPYGVLKYTPAGEGDGYNVTVKLYVNGVLDDGSTYELKSVKSPGNLTFAEKSGYYLFDDENSYDFVTDGIAPTWDPRTGTFNLGAGAQVDGNELRVYLWTFKNHFNLDISRLSDYSKPNTYNPILAVSGYLISYQQVDPATGEMRTYTYEGTSFSSGQRQIVPTNTEITLTAICSPGYEASEWYMVSPFAEAGSLSGNEGTTISVGRDTAWGNVAKLKYVSSWQPDCEIYIGAVRDATAPTADEVVDLVGMDGVRVDCVNTNVEHGDKTYELVADSLTVGSPTEGNTKVEVAVNPATYVDKYNNDVKSSHALSPDPQSVSISLEHDGTGWKVVEGETPVTVTVDCDAEPEPEEPSVPTEDELSDLLEGKVTVTCTNTETAHGFMNYGLLEDSYTRPTPDEVKAGTYSITLNAEKYVDQFGVDKGLVHLLAEGQSPEILVSFEYDSDVNAWKLADVSSAINIDVTCVSAPGFDDIEAAYPNGLVEVECTNVKAEHEPKTYDPMSGGTILNGTLSFNEGKYSYTFEVVSAAYAYQYSLDMKQLHTGKPYSVFVTMTCDPKDGVWTVADNTPIKFEVECDLASGEDVPTLTEDDIKYLLWDSVTINCVNSDADHNPMSKTYGVADVEGGYKLLGIGSNGTNYTATIEIYAGQFINKFESESGVLHGLAEGENDTKTVMLVCDENNKWIADNAKVTFEVVCDDKPVQTAGTIIVTPADITIYQGAKNGYEAVIGEDGNPIRHTDNALPEPLFQIELPEGVSADDVTFKNNDNVWKLDNRGDGYYSFEIDSGDDPVRIQYKDGEELVLSSDFDLSVENDSFKTVEISIYPGENADAKPTAVSADKTYSVVTGTGTLTIRAVDEADPVSEILDSSATEEQIAEELSSEGAAAIEPESTTYTLNDTNVELDDNAEPSLLFDGIIDDEGIVEGGVNRTELLNAKIEERADIDSGFQSEIRYLDLVDANNGNAWIKSSEGVDIYWDYPAETTQSMDFKVLHFENLHRDNSAGGSSGFDPDQIGNASIVEVTEIEKTDEGIKFHVESGNFSPYALVWDYEDNGGTTPGGDGGTTTKYYEIEASAGEGGSISPSGTVRVAAGADKTFTITPDEGYAIGSVIVDGVNYRQISSYTFEDVDEDHTISVTFMRGNDPANPDDTGVSDWLETDDHIVFLHGYGDGSGTFGPENQMTRAEVAQMFYNLLLDKSRGDKPVNFTDVPADAYYAEPVFTLASLGIVNGTSPETFEPNRPITRAEFVAIAMRFTNGEFEGENLFVDVPEDAWYRDYVVGAVGYGWIYGYQDGSQKFGPLDSITRGQATMVTNRMLWRACDTVWAMEHMDQLKTFVDLGQSHYAFFDVVEATNAHDYTRVGDTRYENWTGLVK